MKINNMEINEYEKQAQDFLTKTKTEFTVKFKKNDKYFPDDKETRDIYNITLKRGSRSYTFTFGQSINDTEKHIAPNAYDVLASLEKYDVGTFEDFCSDFGYDTDSRKAEKTYQAVKEQFTQLQTLFNDTELAEMAEIN